MAALHCVLCWQGLLLLGMAVLHNMFSCNLPGTLLVYRGSAAGVASYAQVCTFRSASYRFCYSVDTLHVGFGCVLRMQCTVSVLSEFWVCTAVSTRETDCDTVHVSYDKP